MKKTGLTIILLFCIICCFAQKRTPIQCTADMLKFDENIGDVQIFTGNVVFKHEGSIGYADTVLYYQERNSIEAFGEEIIIHINDSVHLYGKFVHYDGETRIATITKDVMLSDNNGTLYTDELTYDRNEDCGYYLSGGKIVSDSAVLTSKVAYYYTQSHDVYFRKQVEAWHPNFTLTADTLRYNTASKKVFFIGPTEMHSEKYYVESKDGWYQTETEAAAFYQRSQIYYEKQLLVADTILYENLKEKGNAYGNIYLTDTLSKNTLQGNFMELDRQKHYAFATDSAWLTYIDNGDSLFLHADTLWITMDSSQNIETAHSYPQTRFYRKDFQGRCGEVYYIAKDSLVKLLQSPVLWSDSNQFLADTVLVFMQEKNIREVRLIGHAFASENLLVGIHFNQVKSSNMFIYFNNNKLDYAIAEPQAVCLYYIFENDTELVGTHKAQAERMRMQFENNELCKITFYNQIKGEFGPSPKSGERYLPDFLWLETIRPQNKKSIFIKDQHQRVIEKKEEDEDDE